MSVFPMVENQEIVQPEQLNFEDDGVYPGSVLPVLLYRAAITVAAQDRASVFERGFAQNDWRNCWRNGVYSFAHYHSTSHQQTNKNKKKKNKKHQTKKKHKKKKKQTKN